MAEKITFGVFADLHYKKGMYITSVSDLETAFSHFEKNGAELAVHLGDMCNDYIHSPEIVKAYLENKAGLEVFGIYGNHELETAGNDMPTVTPTLTNCPHKVTWGTKSGKIEDGYVAYYYFDKGSYRFIALDTNYSLSSAKEYEHNRPASWGAPSENSLHDSLGNVQLEWLKNTVMDSARLGLRCIVLSHATFCPLWEESPDGKAVREIFREANTLKKGTVILAMNGHYHDNRQAIVEDVTYLDINTVRNGYWQFERYFPYAETDTDHPKYTFEFVDYDENGNEKGREIRAVDSLRMSSRTLYFDTPLFATVTVEENGKIKVKGKTAKWLFGIKPEELTIPDRLLRIDDID